MVFRAAKGDQESPKRLPRGLRRLGRGSLEVPGELLEVHKPPQATILDTFIVSRASKRPPGGPQVTIYRPCRRFRASRRGTTLFSGRVSRGWAGPGRTPGHARARASLDLYILVSNLNADAPSSPEGRRIILVAFAVIGINSCIRTAIIIITIIVIIFVVVRNIPSIIIVVMVIIKIIL